ncbi:hypothetical protein SAMN05216317_10265 [Nitrosomonas eutropha]|nr:hypothetical protein SAMN05216317_10265 [Nitrosomonas eutropha]SEI50038.1 hypothetical protein SAMN05216318_10467 [Nitrosomonas eutropha]
MVVVGVKGTSRILLMSLLDCFGVPPRKNRVEGYANIETITLQKLLRWSVLSVSVFPSAAKYVYLPPQFACVLLH